MGDGTRIEPGVVAVPVLGDVDVTGREVVWGLGMLLGKRPKIQEGHGWSRVGGVLCDWVAWVWWMVKMWKDMVDEGRRGEAWVLVVSL